MAELEENMELLTLEKEVGARCVTGVCDRVGLYVENDRLLHI